MYKIKAKATGELYAGKFFKNQISDMGPKDQLGCLRELEILREVSHPFIIEYVEEFNYNKQHLCIVTKYAPGGDLEQYIKKQSKISEEDAMSYFAMILLGLHYLHNKNIIHRDLKPGNILIDQLANGVKVLKIGDFNISKIDFILDPNMSTNG